MTIYISIVARLESIYGSMLLTVGCVTGGSSSSRLLRIDSRRRRRRRLCCFVSVSPPEAHLRFSSPVEKKGKQTF